MAFSPRMAETEWSEFLSVPQTEAEPSEAGLIRRGRRKERICSFHHAWWKRNEASFF